MRDHTKLTRVFTRATERYMRRSSAYHYQMLGGQDTKQAQRLAHEAIALVVRLGALHPLQEERGPEHGPLHRHDE